jgi:biotin transport system substrate-specific component
MSQGELSTVDTALSQYRHARGRYVDFRNDLDIVTGTGLALGFAALTGLAAQLYVPLTPVPITMQTFAVLLGGVTLGARYGGLSQVFYGGLGAAGVPWFKGGASGVGYATGATGGYIVGFVVAAVCIGLIVDRVPWSRQFPVLVGVMAAGNLVIYAFGLPWLYVVLSAAEPTTVWQTLEAGLIPFVPGDLVKLVAAAAVARAILPLEDDELEGRPTPAGE